MENIKDAVVIIQRDKLDLEKAFQIILHDEPHNVRGWPESLDIWGVSIWPTEFGCIYKNGETVCLIKVQSVRKYDPRHLGAFASMLKEKYGEGVHKIIVD